MATKPVDIPDINKPPPGIPANFWRSYITGDGKNTAGSQTYQAFLKADTPEKKRLYYDYLTNPQYPGSVASSWAGTAPSAKETWQKAEAAGNPQNPFSVEGRQWQVEADRKATRDEGVGVAEDYLKKYMPDYEKVVAAANAGNQAAIQKLLGVIDSIKDPQVEAFIDDYVSQAATAGPSQEAIRRQISDYDKLKSLSDPTITAEERLMQEMSRRQQENDLKAQQGAFANDLQARGMYGSGAEIALNMGAAQESAQRRAYEEMQAQANAQKRAMDSLYKATDLGTSIRGSEAQESQFRGTAADRAKEFKMGLKENAQKWRAELTASLNRDRVTRAGTAATAVTGANRDQVAAQGGLAGAGAAGAQMHITSLYGGSPPVHKAEDDTTARTAYHQDEPVYG